MSESNERKIRTGTEKARDALEKAARKEEAAQKRHDRLSAEFTDAQEKLREAKAEHAFAQTHPLLQEPAEGNQPGFPGVGSEG